jgi:hypothetical protein
MERRRTRLDDLDELLPTVTRLAFVGDARNVQRGMVP